MTDDRHPLMAAWERRENAAAEVNSWSRVIAANAVRGELPPDEIADRLIVATAELHEATAAWQDARTTGVMS